MRPEGAGYNAPNAEGPRRVWAPSLSGARSYRVARAVLVNLLRFVALIGGLVFVHELGHFAWAKIFNVKVLKFSLGFGPRVIGYRHQETDYCVSLIPLGGFVKMLGEDPSDHIAPEDVPRSFHRQALWKRFLIVLAGPLMSLMFPVLLYFVVFLGQTDLTPPVIGTVVPGYPAENRLMPGDRVLAVDGRTVGSFQDVRDAVSAAPAREMRFDVQRGDQHLTVRVTPESVRIERPLDITETVGRAGISAGFALPVIGVRGPNVPAWVSGLRTFDLVTMYAGNPIRRWIDLERVLQASRGATVPLGFLRPRVVPDALGGLCDLEVFDPGLAQITPEPGTGEVLRRTGIEPADLYVADVSPDSPEYQMGLRRGARVVSVDGEAPPSWERFHERIMSGGRQLRSLRFLHEGRESQGAFSLRPTSWTDEFGQRYVRLAFETGHWVPTDADAPIENPSPTTYALRNAMRETSEAMRFLSTGIVRVLQGRVSIQTVGGPIMIYDVTRSTASDGPWGFLWLMALVSINLGLINLLPIPTLDGGHLMFFAVEGVIRRPVPLWIRQTASVLGLLLVLGVMLIAFKNDLQRKFGNTQPIVVTAPTR